MRHHPRRATAGDHHLRRRPEVLPAPRSHPGARDLACPRSTPPATRRSSRTRARRGSRRSSTTPGSRAGASRRCTRRSSRAARRARTPRWFERGLPERRRAASRRSSTSATGCTAARAALLAHRTQVDPEGFWMRLPDDVIREVFPWEEFLLARSLVDNRRRRGRHRGRSVRRRCGRRDGSDDVARVPDPGVARRAAHAGGRAAGPRGRDRRRIQYVVSGGPDGDVKYSWSLEDGKRRSRPTSARSTDPDLTITVDVRDRGEDRAGRARPERRVHAGTVEGGGRHGQAPAAAARSRAPTRTGPSARSSPPSPTSEPRRSASARKTAISAVFRARTRRGHSLRRCMRKARCATAPALA